MNLLSTWALRGASFGLASLLVSSVVWADGHEKKESASVAEMFSDGEMYANFRYRYEFAEQDAAPKDAHASTLRTRLGFKSGEYMGIMGQLEFEDVREVGDDNYNSTINGETDRPVVADPESTEVNQAFLQYSGVSDTAFAAGRRAVKLDNERFIGSVDWRQNNQTQDGATVTNTSLEDTTLFYGYAYGINRIFGEDSPMGEWDTNIHMFNAKHTGLDFGNLAAYVYLLDIDESPVNSTASYGARFDGKTEVSDGLNLVYDLEYAFQQDYADNPNSYDASFFRAEGGLNGHGLTFKVGFESLGSDGGDASFSTPLSTLHKFNGWADIFLVTPDTGLEDAYAKLIYQPKGMGDLLEGTKFIAAYHDFSAEEGGADYGTEWNFLVSKKLDENFSTLVKYANYSSDGFATDTERLIFEVAAFFG